MLDNRKTHARTLIRNAIESLQSALILLEDEHRLINTSKAINEGINSAVLGGLLLDETRKESDNSPA
jgi:hypothetical protein